MVAYGSFLYFGLLVYVVAVATTLAWFGVRVRTIVLGTTLLMIVVQYGLGAHGLAAAPVVAIARVLGFAVMQFAVARAFLARRAAAPRRGWFRAVVVVALLPLLLEKFAPGSPHSVVAFVGISYATFRALDVIFGIQDGVITELPAADYAAFLLFFPAISAGPIDRYRRFRGDFRQARTREQLRADLDEATVRVMRGVLYSFVLAPLIDVYWMTPATKHAGPAWLLSYTYAYSLHLFFDFAGYSALALGTGYALGIRSAENFNRPFLATNIAEFWTRWHVSLSSWLRDHVYGRFVMAAMLGKWFAHREWNGYGGSALAFALMGLWHGASWHYVAYGLYHAVMVVGYGMLTAAVPGRPRRAPLNPWVARLITFHVVCAGFLIFSGRLF